MLNLYCITVRRRYITMDINNDLQCGICLDVATKAVETSCCHQLFCEPCLAPKEVKNCPMCRKQLRTWPNLVIRRIIGKLKQPCIFCHVPIERSNLEAHQETCPERLLHTCIVENCTFSANKKNILLHMTENHATELTSSKYQLVLKKTRDQSEPMHVCNTYE